MKKKEIIYLTREDYKKIENEISELEEKIRKVNQGRKAAFDAGAGDGWDSPEFEEIERAEAFLAAKIKVLKAQLANAVMVEEKSEEHLVSIGDIVKLRIGPSLDKGMEVILKLIARDEDPNSEFQQISINSPIGAAIIGKKFGETVSYSVGEKVMVASIIEKVKLEKEKR